MTAEDIERLLAMAMALYPEDEPEIHFRRNPPDDGPEEAFEVILGRGVGEQGEITTREHFLGSTMEEAFDRAWADLEIKGAEQIAALRAAFLGCWPPPGREQKP